MRIRLIAIGTRMPDWIASGYEDYAARLPRELKLELVELAVEHRGKNADIPRLREAEGERLLKAAGEARIIAFDEHGTQPDTVAWSKSLKTWMQDGRDVALLIGGPDGHAPAVLARADAKWSLSKLTFPHALVRVIVAEQLYRAWTLLNNHPYHRA
ncbi:23S rRNA (pseudouridine(1915)-N(3))-methyltransferase RlmH [Nevskia ramosa]|uniref:23S rRNA (pseudouridine(1915)-N(3))-methyltransferase RlmH n=1 Tax=Nevskia ramosa TaxID=64002 RepID=UPI0003B3A38D|nr:23S rRNA (pseudouridine(1915)-N(3))-methyltransferase RlmH [Nevskia ramosa]